jgi:hypothetical protein
VIERFPNEITGSLAAAFFGGWSGVNIQHTPMPAALYDLSGAYAWSHLVQGLQRFRVAQHVETLEVHNEVSALGATTDLKARLVCGDVPFEGRPILVRLVATGSEVLLTKPVRRGRERLVFAPTDLGGAANWWWLSDVLAGVAHGGEFPSRILQALEFVPVGLREAVKPIRLPGGRSVDPRREDLGAIAREERQSVLHDETLPPWQRRLIEGQLRLLGSALDFGNTSRIDRDTTRRLVEESVVTPDGELITYRTLHPERPGPHFDLLVAGAVTSRVRLAMAASIAGLASAGGTWLHAATDSLMIPITHNDEALFVACRGGPHRRGRRRGVSALPISQVEEILKVTGAPWRCQHGHEKPMIGHVAGTYKYQLLDQETGQGIATESALGGSYVDPTGTNERTGDGHFAWAVQASLAVARAALQGDKSGAAREIDLPPWAEMMAVRPGMATSSAQIQRLQQAFPDRRVRPFTPYLVAVVDHTRSLPVTPITLEVDLSPHQWPEAHWVDATTGESLILTTRENPSIDEVRVEPIRDVVARWRIPDDPHTEAIEPVNDILQPGMRRSLPVRSRPELVELVGKEGDDLLSLMNDPLADLGDQLTTYRRADPWPGVREVAKRIEMDQLVAHLPRSRRTIERALTGASVSGKTKAMISAAVEVLLASGGPIDPRVCRRPGCGVPVSRRQKWCSDSCRKKVERGRDAVDLHRVGAVRCPQCHGVTFGERGMRCPSCGGKGAIELRTNQCLQCGVERIGNTDSPCPVCEKGNPS